MTAPDRGARIVEAFQRAAEGLSSVSSSAAAATAAAEEFTHAAAHLLPDDQVEARTATCRVCGAATVGTWQIAGGGRRLRTPSEHNAPPGLRLCEGSFQGALLTTTPEKGPRK